MIICRVASGDVFDVGAGRADSRNMQVQSSSRCSLRNRRGNRTNMPNRRRVPRTQDRARAWGRTDMGWKLILRLGPVRVQQFLTPPAHL